MQTYFIHTMGCQMNERDSETLAGILEELGYRRAEGAAEADVVLLNTCAVREKPEQKVFSLLGEMARHKRRRPGTIIGVCGCVAQASAEAIREQAPQVDLIIGPRNYADLPALLEALPVRRASSPANSSAASLEWDRCIPEGLPEARENAVTAYVNITYGCDNYCAYCIVPYARGPLQSRRPQAVLDEVKRLVDSGYRQITLLGQNVNAYGQDLDEAIDFPELLYRVDQLCAGQRVRFTTSHPKDVPPRLIEAMRELPSVCEWLHLPLQSGDDEVLARMGRGYTAREYLDLVSRAREEIPGLTVTTDVMVGFPGETEAQFEHTYRLMETIRFDQAFTFKFSPRRGTAAEKMPDQVREPVKQERLQRLAEMVARVARQVNRRQVGEVLEVLVEEADPKAAEHVRGRTRGNKLVIFPGGPELIGQMVPVRAEEARLWGFRGQVVT
jgi:tRNA-2-methylthio-N6-dimethylallyladenosine synthase